MSTLVHSDRSPYSGLLDLFNEMLGVRASPHRLTHKNLIIPLSLTLGDRVLFDFKSDVEHPDFLVQVIARKAGESGLEAPIKVSVDLAGGGREMFRDGMGRLRNPPARHTFLTEIQEGGDVKVTSISGSLVDRVERQLADPMGHNREADEAGPTC